MSNHARRHAYLLTPTNVVSKQLFSGAAQLYADQRNCLAVENAEKLLFPVYSICLFNLNY